MEIGSSSEVQIPDDRLSRKICDLHSFLTILDNPADLPDQTDQKITGDTLNIVREECIQAYNVETIPELEAYLAQFREVDMIEKDKQILTDLYQHVSTSDVLDISLGVAFDLVDMAKRYPQYAIILRHCANYLLYIFGGEEEGATKVVTLLEEFLNLADSLESDEESEESD